jgi:hypothetical protein
MEMRVLLPLSSNLYKAKEVLAILTACLMEDPYWLRFSEDETFEDTTRGRARRIMNENQKSS